MPLTTKEIVSNVFSAMFLTPITSAKFYQTIAFSPMTMVFAQNVKMVIILMKLNNVNYCLKIVSKLMRWDFVSNVDLDSNFLLENVQLEHQVDQILTVLNKIKKVNVQNVEISIN